MTNNIPRKEINIDKYRSLGNKQALLEYIKDFSGKKRKLDIENDLVHRTSKKHGKTEKKIMSYGMFNKYLKELLNEKKIEKNNNNSFEYKWNVYTLINGDFGIEELYSKIRKKLKSFIGFDAYNVRKLYFSDKTSEIYAKNILNLINDIFINNPETWTFMTKPEHYKFWIKIDFDLNEDLELFDYFMKLRNEKKLERSLEEIYKIAFAEELIREQEKNY